MAIPDKLVDEMYFYVSHWNADGQYNYNNLPPPASKSSMAARWI
jgi:hypothetical protein